jgi:hypothetical protein
MRIQTTPNQTIIELWSGDRKLTIYLDQHATLSGESHTSVDIFQVESRSPDEDEIHETKDFIESLQWLANNSKNERISS